jgi:methylenetetrahydrofolate dehydrogenase (NADP+)/methenyltetrahydrofolate cyclohydrolase
MKILNGRELVGYIEERQARQVRALRQSWLVLPHLAIIQTTDNPVIDVYVNLKRQYGEEILVDVSVHKPTEDDLLACIATLNADETVHGIIIQLPMANSDLTQAAVDAVAPQKDVDGLGSQTLFEAATPMAIDWLLAGYNVDVAHKKIAIVGEGRLVGRPLAKLWRSGGYNVTTFNESTGDLSSQLRDFEIIVSATGVPGLITSAMVQPGAVVVDAGTASEHGKIVGDVADELRERNDLTITPRIGGVGPLTVAALFDNVIRAARTVADAKGQQDL